MHFEVIVVDDSSTDRTREIAEGFGGVRVVSPGPVNQGWTGKNNAVIAGARAARANWLLFTDADTVHLPGSVDRALDEAKRESADLLSYSPEQVVVTLAERAVMPVVFAELAAQYPPHKVRERDSGIVAANGQYILVRRAAYDAAGGHTAVATEILEDVALARRFRDAGYRVYFRFGGDAVSTRMYRNWMQLREGWTKNLALLFPKPELLAFQRILWWGAAWIGLGFAIAGAAHRQFWWIVFAALWLLVYRRIRIAHFANLNNVIAITLGIPMFVYLLLRSKKAHVEGKVEWKGRSYDVGRRETNFTAETQGGKPKAPIQNQRGLSLKIEN